MTNENNSNDEQIELKTIKHKVSGTKKEPIKKEAAPIPKYYFDVKVESLLPCTLTYRIFAETAEQAAELIKNQHPNGVKYKLIGRKDIKLSVYLAGGSMLKFMKKLGSVLK